MFEFTLLGIYDDTVKADPRKLLLMLWLAADSYVATERQKNVISALTQLL